MKEAMEQVKLAADVLNKQADSWKKIGEALEKVSGPSGLATFIGQGGIVRDAQAEQP
jgi:hypothetical protein